MRCFFLAVQCFDKFSLKFDGFCSDMIQYDSFRISFSASHNIVFDLRNELINKEIILLLSL